MDCPKCKLYRSLSYIKPGEVIFSSLQNTACILCATCNYYTASKKDSEPLTMIFLLTMVFLSNVICCILNFAMMLQQCCNTGQSTPALSFHTYFANVMGTRTFYVGYLRWVVFWRKITMLGLTLKPYKGKKADSTAF